MARTMNTSIAVLGLTQIAPLVESYAQGDKAGLIYHGFVASSSAFYFGVKAVTHIFK